MFTPGRQWLRVFILYDMCIKLSAKRGTRVGNKPGGWRVRVANAPLRDGGEGWKLVERREEAHRKYLRVSSGKFKILLKGH